MMDSKEIGRRIRSAREAVGLSLSEVAAKIGVHKSTVLRYENGEISKVKAPIIEALALSLGVSPHYLMCWTDDPGFHTVPDATEREQELLDLFRRLSPAGQATMLKLAEEEAQKGKTR